jgi:Putative DNA-binding domain
VNLLDLQRQMSEDVRRPLTPDWDMQPQTEDGRSITEIADGYVKPNALLTSFERLEIYNRQYWFRVIGAVAEDYPALNAVLGSRRFDAMVLAYLKENPSTSFTLRNIGAKLPAWLAANSEITGARHGLAVDVARLEWAYVDAYDSASLTPFSEEDFAGLGAETRLRLQPHVQLLDLTYPVDELVLAVRKEAPEIEVASNAVSEVRQNKRAALPRMRKSAIWLAVHRYDDSVYYRRIDREAFLLLRSLRDGASIAEALESAFDASKLTPEQQAAKIQEYFAHAAELGWFCSPEPN